MSSPRRVCATHPKKRASFVCDGCGELLCWDCVEEGAHLMFCRLCGERALPLDAPPEPEVVEPDGPVPVEAPPTADLDEVDDLTAGIPEDLLAAEPRLYESEASVELESPEARVVDLAVQHVIVPAATITMVTALLFFLLDVRSVFLSGGVTLKWIGFWFVIATVLIVRYGRVHAGQRRQGCYIAALGWATIVVMVASPWSPVEADPLGALVNLLIVALVWRFAGRLTVALSPDDPRREPRPLLYGLERLRFEAWQRGRGRQVEQEEDAGRSGSPGTAVARLAVGALVLFALGEPFLLAGPPEVGGRALAAMIVFLGAGGIVMAAGSVAATARRVRADDGRVPLTVMPARIAASLLVMVVLLAVAAVVPGVEFRGRGWLEPERAADGTEHELGDPGDAESTDAPARGEDGELESSARESSQGEAEGDTNASSSQATASTALAIPRFFAGLGKFLIVPIVVGAVLFGLWWAARRWRRDGTLARGWRDRLRAWLSARLAVLGRLFSRRRSASTGRSLRDPFAALGDLRLVEPEAAIVTAYERSLILLDRLGYPRSDRLTPHEYLNGLPTALRGVARHLGILTTLYVKAVYSSEAPDQSDRGRAVAVLDELRTWWRGQKRT